MEREIREMWEKELKLFVIEFNKGAQIDRSFREGITNEKKKAFREALLRETIHLFGKVDDGSLKNENIFNSIKKVKDIDKNISFGQAQKVINVAVKQYCFITKQKENILQELDCPLDSITMKGCGIKNRKMCDVSEEDYVNYQKYFKEKCGLKILKDVEYDDNRISEFMKGGKNE
ncbi:MAG: hypothetical protein FWF51_11350 [Chitinivibrionia bacterium]|nr:hypothetical protein [Chitinivibrionia bacterium]